MLKQFIYILVLLLAFFLLVASQRTRAEAPDVIIEYPVEIQGDPVKMYAYRQVLFNFGEGQWESFNKIVIKESRWDSEARNPRSTAFGSMQFLDTTWKLVGCVKTTDPYVQLDCGIKYVQQRYGNPQRALQFHYQNDWY